MSCSCAAGDGAPHDDECEGASLFGAIDLPRVACLNEEVAGSAVGVLRPLVRRRDTAAGVLRSVPDDPELLLHIPFTSPCRIKSLCVSNGLGGGAPSAVRLFASRDDLDFSSVGDATPDQVLSLAEDPTADVWHPLKQVRFGSASSLTLHLRAEGAAQLVVTFVGLKGVASGLRRGAVTAVYEARAQLSDHTMPADVAAGARMGQ